jgi:hypothetical protein
VKVAPVFKVAPEPKSAPTLPEKEPVPLCPTAGTIFFFFLMNCLIIGEKLVSLLYAPVLRIRVRMAPNHFEKPEPHQSE